MIQSTARRATAGHIAPKIPNHCKRLADVARARAIDQQRLADNALGPNEAASHVARREHLIELADVYDKQAECD